MSPRESKAVLAPPSAAPARVGRGWGWLEGYVVGVIGLGAVGLVWAASRWQAVDLGIWELALFIGLAGVLDLMVVPLAGGGGAAASFAVFFAGLLVLGAGPTACVAALAAVWSEGMVRRSPVVRSSFNAAHSVLSLLAAGWVYQELGGVPGRVELGVHVVAVVGAVVCLWLLETGWVSVAVALERPRRAGAGLWPLTWRRLRASLGPMLALDGALASVGLLLALLYQSRWQLTGEAVGASSSRGALLLGVVTLIPSGLLYYGYRLQGHLRQVYAQSLRTLGAVMEAKLEGRSLEASHGERVAAVAAAMAQVLDLAPDQVEQIRYAGYLHDIGKVGVPGELLPGDQDLFSGELEPLRLHPQLGAQILAPVRFLRPAAQMVGAHHERWDGLGYPEGLRQHQIPLGARLLALADAYLELAGSPQALSRLRQAAGSRFDPELVEVLAAAAQQPDRSFSLTPQPEASPDLAWWR